MWTAFSTPPLTPFFHNSVSPLPPAGAGQQHRRSLARSSLAEERSARQREGGGEQRGGREQQEQREQFEQVRRGAMCQCVPVCASVCQCVRAPSRRRSQHSSATATPRGQAAAAQVNAGARARGGGGVSGGALAYDLLSGDCNPGARAAEHVCKAAFTHCKTVTLSSRTAKL